MANNTKRKTLTLFPKQKRKENMTMTGHNSESIKEDIAKLVNEYVESLERSAEENDIRTELRDKAEELGLDKKALQDSVTRAKQSLKKREGYDESMALIKEVVDDIGTENLFSWVLDKEEEKKAAREKAREEKKKAREAEKAKNDEYKPATERAPKNSKQKSVGEQQAEAVMNAGQVDNEDQDAA